MIDLEKAKHNPASIFRRPREVLKCQEFSRQQKIHILQQWAYDERELQVAEEENMQNHNASTKTNFLEEILHCLIELDAAEQESPPPTKQG